MAGTTIEFTRIDAIGPPRTAPAGGVGSDAAKHLVRPSPSLALFLLDAVAIALCWPVLLALAGLLPPPTIVAWLARLLYPASGLASLYMLGLYRRDMILETGKALGRLPLAIGLGGLGALALLALLGAPLPNQGWLFTAFVGCGSVGGALARILFYALRRRGLFRRRLLVLGAGRRAWDLMWMLGKEGRNLNYRMIFLHDPALGEIDPRLAAGGAGPVISVGRHGPLAVARRFAVEQIVVAPDERRGMDLASSAAMQGRRVSGAAVSRASSRRRSTASI